MSNSKSFDSPGRQTNILIDNDVYPHVQLLNSKIQGAKISQQMYSDQSSPTKSYIFRLDINNDEQQNLKQLIQIKQQKIKNQEDSLLIEKNENLVLQEALKQQIQEASAWQAKYQEIQILRDQEIKQSIILLENESHNQNKQQILSIEQQKEQLSLNMLDQQVLIENLKKQIKQIEIDQVNEFEHFKSQIELQFQIKLDQQVQMHTHLLNLEVQKTETKIINFSSEYENRIQILLNTNQDLNLAIKKMENKVKDIENLEKQVEFQKDQQIEQERSFLQQLRQLNEQIIDYRQNIDDQEIQLSELISINNQQQYQIINQDDQYKLNIKLIRDQLEETIKQLESQKLNLEQQLSLTQKHNEDLLHQILEQSKETNEYKMKFQQKLQYEIELISQSFKVKLSDKDQEYNILKTQSDQIQQGQSKEIIHLSQINNEFESKIIIIQKELYYLTQISEEQKDKISKLLTQNQQLQNDINVNQKEQDIDQKKIKQLNGQIEFLKEDLIQLNNKFQLTEKKYKINEEQLNVLSRDQLDKQHKILTADHEQAQESQKNEMEKMKKYYEEIVQQLKNEIENQNQSIEELETEIEETTISTLKNGKTELNDAQIRWNTEKSNLESIISQIKLKLQNETQLKETFEEQSNKLKQKLKDKATDFEKQRELIEDLENKQFEEIKRLKQQFQDSNSQDEVIRSLEEQHQKTIKLKDEQIKNLEQKLQKTEQEKNLSQQRNNEEKNSNDQIRNELEKVLQEKKNLQTKSRQMQNEITDLTEDLQTVQADNDQLKQQIADLRDSLAESEQILENKNKAMDEQLNELEKLKQSYNDNNVETQINTNIVRKSRKSVVFTSQISS